MREVDRVRIPRVGMAHHAGAGICCEHAAQLLAAERRPIGDGDHARVYGVADADAAAMMQRDPRGAGRRVHERVEDRPVRDRVASITHRLGLAERRRDRARIEAVASDYDRRAELAARDEIVDALAELGALPVAQPAHTRRKTLEWDTLAGEPDPASETAILGEELEN